MVLRRRFHHGRHLVVVERVLVWVKGATLRILPVILVIIVIVVGVKRAAVGIFTVVLVVPVPVVAVLIDRVAVLVVQGRVVLPLGPVGLARRRRVFASAVWRLPEHLGDLFVKWRLPRLERVL